MILNILPTLKTGLQHLLEKNIAAFVTLSNALFRVTSLHETDTLNTDHEVEHQLDSVVVHI